VLAVYLRGRNSRRFSLSCEVYRVSLNVNVLTCSQRPIKLTMSAYMFTREVLHS